MMRKGENNKTKIKMCNMFNHTLVISLLQVPGQLTFGKNLSKWGLGASIRLNQEKQQTHHHNASVLTSYIVL